MTVEILVISPAAGVREMLARYLSSDDFIVYTADSARMALPMIQNLSLNAIISELDIKEASGVELLLWLNRKYPEILPIFLCDTQDTELMYLLREQRASVLSRKHLNLLDFRTNLREMLKYPRATTYQFKQLNLFELVHLASRSGQSKHVYITSPQTAQEGLIYFAQGNVKHAMYDTFSGEEAFYEIMQMKQGLFQETQMGQSAYYSIVSNLDQLMALSALKLDQSENAQMPTTHCTVLSPDMGLADYFIETFPDAELEMLYTDQVSEALEQVETRADLLIVDLDLADFQFEKLMALFEEKNLTARILLMGSEAKSEISLYLRYPNVERFFLKPMQYWELGDLVNQTFLSQQFTGNLLNLPLLNVLQTMNYFRRPRLLEMTDFFSGLSGQLFLAEGEVQHAVFGDLTGRDALKEMLGIRHGLFRQATYWEPSERSLNVSFTRLLLYLGRFVEKINAESELPRDILLQNGSMMTLQTEKIPYVLATLTDVTEALSV